MTMTTSEPPSGDSLVGNFVLLVLVGIPIAYTVGFWWMFGRAPARSDQTDEDVAVTRDSKE